MSEPRHRAIEVLLPSDLLVTTGKHLAKRIPKHRKDVSMSESTNFEPTDVIWDDDITQEYIDNEHDEEGR